MLFVFAILLCPTMIFASIAGDWSGIVVLPQQRLHFVLHVTGSDTDLRATADSPDQGGYGYPVDLITISGQTLSFRMDALSVFFIGRVNGDQIAGTFKQRGFSVPLTISRSSASPDPNRQNSIIGTWSGILAFPQQKLHFVLHITGSNTDLHATADSPDQGGYGYSVESISISGQTLTFQMNALAVNFTGQVKGNQIAGNFNQNGFSVPLTLNYIGQ